MNSSYLLLNSLRFHYFSWNPRGNGPIVICHHGLASNARIWELVAPLLAERDCRVYALDARDHGLTDKPDDGYDTAAITADLTAFINACQFERPLLIGHSWGANIILNYAARFAVGPLAPTGIVLVDGGVTQMDDQGSTWQDMEQRLTPPDLAGMPVDEFVARLRRWNSDWGITEQAISIFLDNFEIGEDERITPRLTRSRHMQIVRSIWDFKTYDFFQHIRCPVLALPCRSTKPDSSGHLAAKERGVEKARQALVRLQVRWMENAIHDVPLQQPEAVAAAIAGFAAGLER